MTNARNVGLASFAWVLLAGCGPVATRSAPAISSTRDALDADNGYSLNGTLLNGESMQGESMQGESMQGESMQGPNVVAAAFSFDDVTLNGDELSDVHLVGNQLAGALDGAPITGAAFTGAKLRVVLANGRARTAHIVGVMPWGDAEVQVLNGPSLNGESMQGESMQGESMQGESMQGRGANGGGSPDGGIIISEVPGTPDMLAYQVTVTTRLGDQPLCGLDANGSPLPAVALAGRWDYRSHVVGGGAHIDDPAHFTFGCLRTGALGKCTLLGYWPWTDANAARHHQACTRMIRADYCGDGTPHTVNGMLINLYDDEGIQTDAENWPFEAEWDPAGAVCVAHQRIYNTTRVHCSTPHTFAPQNTCGDLAHFQSGTLLMDEYAPSDQIR